MVSGTMLKSCSVQRQRGKGYCISLVQTVVQPKLGCTTALDGYSILFPFANYYYNHNHGAMSGKGTETQKFGIKQVDMDHVSTVKRE